MNVTTMLILFRTFFNCDTILLHIIPGSKVKVFRCQKGPKLNAWLRSFKLKPFREEAWNFDTLNSLNWMLEVRWKMEVSYNYLQADSNSELKTSWLVRNLPPRTRLISRESKSRIAKPYWREKWKSAASIKTNRNIRWRSQQCRLHITAEDFHRSW